MSADQILEALDPDQRAVATALTGPVCVLAGAGTGKTRAITHRIAYGVRTGAYQPTSVLAVTFTARAAGEMRTRLRDLGVGGVQARTFHAAALKQLGYFWPQVVGGAPPRILEHKAQAVAQAANVLGMKVDRVAVRDLASEIEWAKVSMVPPDDYVETIVALRREPPAGFDAHSVARLLRAYEEVKTTRGVMDFEDVLLFVAGMISSHATVADEVRRQYRRFVVDEYQDVSPLQQLLLEQWLGDRDELCVVGDPSQTIYSFTGATPHHLLSFRTTYPKAVEVRLVRDYRSTPQVVNLANALLADRAGRGFAGLELKAQRKPGPPVTFAVHDDDEQEAAHVAAAARRLVAQGTPASEIAVLYRTNSQSELFEQAFSEAGVPYLVRGGERFFARTEVREALVYLRGAVRAVPPDQPLPEAVRDVLLSAGWAPEPPTARGAARERWESMQALVALADELHATTGGGLAELVAELDERAASQHAPTVQGVTLASLHAAKGLEWDAVFLVGLSEGLMPISLAETPDAVAEEKRLLYVGITRARVHLQLSWARSRTPLGRASRSRSQFLERLWPTGAPSRTTKVQTQARLTGEADVDLVAELTQWRDATAAALGRSRSGVVADPTLGAIAEVRPRDLDGLLAIRGIGVVKASDFGEQILAIVRRHDGSL